MPISNENGKNSRSLISIESDSDQEIQIISEQMMKANNEPTHKKIRLSVDKGSEHEHSSINEREDENLQNEIFSDFFQSPESKNLENHSHCTHFSSLGGD